MLFALIWNPRKGNLSVSALERLTRTLDYFNYNEEGPEKVGFPRQRVEEQRFNDLSVNF